MAEKHRQPQWDDIQSAVSLPIAAMTDSPPAKLGPWAYLCQSQAGEEDDENSK